MKLNSLSFSKYKNLENVSLNLERSDGVVVFAGRNGMGKSNFLESIVLILQSARRNGDIGQGCPKEYSFSVEDNRKSIRCERDKCGFKCYINDDEAIFPDDFPRQVVAVYSGDSRRLLREVESCDERFVYLDYRTIPVALAILLSSERESVKDFVREIFHSPQKISIEIKVSNRRLNSNRTEEADRTLFRELGRYNRNIIKLAPIGLNDWIRTIGSEQDAFSYLTRNWQDGTKGFIRDIVIRFENDKKAKIDASQLSEGEIKLAFFKAIYEFIAEDQSIILLDEPDAHVHEFWKIKLLHLFKSYAEIGRQTIFTTHSPGMINGVNPNCLVSLTLDENKRISACVSNDISNLFSALGEDRMSFYSNKPIVMFEGKIDITYLWKALDYFNKGYLREKLHFFSYGGAGDVDFVYKIFCKTFHGRQIRVYCDKDSGGKDAMRLMAKHFNLIKDSEDSHTDELDSGNGIDKDTLSRLNEKDVFYLPKPQNSNDEYAIEDYFTSGFILKSLNDQLKKDGHICVKALSKVGDRVKRALYTGRIKIPNDEFQAFAPLVRSIEVFYRKSCGTEDVDLSFVVPIVSAQTAEFVDAQMKSFKSASFNCPSLSVELIIVDVRAETDASVLPTYGTGTKLFSARGKTIEDAIKSGFGKSKGAYVCVFWQHSTIQDKVFVALDEAISYQPDFMMFDANLESNDVQRFCRVKDGEVAERIYRLINGSQFDVSHFCVKRELALKLCEKNIQGVFSTQIGLWLLGSSSSIWIARRDISKWRDNNMQCPKISHGKQSEDSLKEVLNACQWIKHNDDQ